MDKAVPEEIEEPVVEQEPGEVTAEFNTEEIKKEAATLQADAPAAQKSTLGSWIPFIIGLIATAVMVTITFLYWLAP